MSAEESFKEFFSSKQDGGEGGSGDGDNGDGGGSQIPPYMKDPWVIAFGIGGALLISMLALRMREESIPDNFVSWKELKTEYLDAGLVCILMYT